MKKKKESLRVCGGERNESVGKGQKRERNRGEENGGLVESYEKERERKKERETEKSEGETESEGGESDSGRRENVGERENQ